MALGYYEYRIKTMKPTETQSLRKSLYDALLASCDCNVTNRAYDTAELAELVPLARKH